MRRISPLVQLTVALVLLTSTLLAVAALLIDVAPSRAAQLQRTRQQTVDTLAVQVAGLLSAGQRDPADGMLRTLARQLDGVDSVAVRLADGSLLLDSGAHGDHWPAEAAPAPHRMSVPLWSRGRRWGALEIAFRPDDRPALQRWLDEPLLQLFGFMVAAGGLAFGLYMRRALQHLDPASVIPDRVQRAFDALAEGVVVLDASGRVMLLNRALGSLHPDAARVRQGQLLSAVPWLASTLEPDPERHPWARAMSERANTAGEPIEIGTGTADPRQTVVRCAPITDPGGHVRGCLVTFQDLTALHHANAALQQAMGEVLTAQQEVQAKNAELLRLATRDPMTGCLNRRALYEALVPLHADCRRDGRPLGCLVLDIDFFKEVNDTHGHGVGDRVIQEVARALHDVVGDNGLVCRYGGEEFVAAAADLAPPRMQALAEAVRARIEAECGPAVSEVPGLRVTASVGCDDAGQLADTAQAMIDRADQALYQAKRSGRNRVALVDRSTAAAAA